MILEKLAEIAVLGTSKKNIKSELLDWGKQYKIPSNYPEQYLLQAAYLDLQMREAGKILEKDENFEQIEAIEDEKNAVDDNYIYYLKQILEEFPYLILPYVERLISAKKILPASIVPQFLDFAKRQDPDFKEKINLVAGNRAAFLAKYNANWDFLAIKEIDWETSSHKERLVFVRNLRKNNPEKSVELIRSCFSEEHSKEKLELLQCLTINLGKYDKAFLQSCMENRGQQVVQTAFDYLLKLDKPQQEFLKKEASPYIKIHKGGFLTANRLEINLPEKDEGIFKKLGNCNHTGANLGKKATLLHKIISRLPIDYYSILYSDLIKIAEKNEWRAMLLSAWQNAAINYNDSQWAVELIPVLIKYNISIDTQLTQNIDNREFNTILKQSFSSYPKQFKNKEAIGILLKSSRQEIDLKNAEVGIKQISDLLNDLSNTNNYLYSEDKKILFDFFARIPWNIDKLPENLEDYKELIDIKQKLIKSI